MPFLRLAQSSALKGAKRADLLPGKRANAEKKETSPLSTGRSVV